MPDLSHLHLRETFKIPSFQHDCTPKSSLCLLGKINVQCWMATYWLHLRPDTRGRHSQSPPSFSQTLFNAPPTSQPQSIQIGESIFIYCLALYYFYMTIQKTVGHKEVVSLLSHNFLQFSNFSVIICRRLNMDSLKCVHTKVPVKFDILPCTVSHWR